MLAMYHDQGLPVLKHAAFGRGVNITLGLPIIRTSVDHGTALDLAARGLGEVDAAACTRRSASPSRWSRAATAINLQRHMKHVARKRFGQNFLTDDQRPRTASSTRSTRARATPWSRSAPAWPR